MTDTDTVEMLPEGRRLPPQSADVTAELAGLSDVGRVRQNNEDHFLITRFGRHLTVAESNLPAGMVVSRAEEQGVGLAVADGIGGSQGGEEASRRAIAALVRLVLETPDWILRMDDEAHPREVARRTAERYERVGRMLAEEAGENPDLIGFGTTLTVAFTAGRALFVGHVGDSRAYLVRDRRLVRLTRDHTVAQSLADRHHISQLEAATHRLRHVLTRSVGDREGPVQPDVARAELADQDRLLVCSDGLTEMVPEEIIADVLSSDAPVRGMCETLVRLANEAGGKDNITVALARFRVK